MKRQYFIIIAIIFCLAGLNKVYYDTYQKTVERREHELIVNKERMEPDKLFVMVSKLVEKQYIDEDLNHQNWRRWVRRYKNKIKTEADMKVAVDTMIASLNDPYTHFLKKKEYKKLNTSIKAKIYGIGVNIYEKSGQIIVYNVIPGAPAEYAGLKANDIILKVNNISCKDKKIDEVAELIKGKKGTTVTLTIRRGKIVFTKEVKRGEIKLKTIITKKYGEIGYIGLSSFLSSGMENEFETALESTADSKGLIIDLRGNTGGLLDNAVLLAEKFIDAGTIVSVVSRGGIRCEIKADENVEKIHKPIVILINEASASASEIFSGAMKDYGAATIIGHKSFGKAMVQNVIPLPNETALNLTVAKYLTPKDYDINQRGIEPHIVVDLPRRVLKEADDKQLNAAKSYLNKLIISGDSVRISNSM